MTSWSHTRGVPSLNLGLDHRNMTVGNYLGSEQDYHKSVSTGTCIFVNKRKSYPAQRPRGKGRYHQWPVTPSTATSCVCMCIMDIRMFRPYLHCHRRNKKKRSQRSQTSFGTRLTKTSLHTQCGSCTQAYI